MRPRRDWCDSRFVMPGRLAARVGRVNRAVVSLVLLVLVSACSTGTDTSEEKPRPKPALELTVRPDVERLVVDGTAIAPDGTRVTLLVGRNVKFAKDDVPRSTTIAKGEARVDGGRFHARLPVDESQLVFDANGERYGEIEVISDSVTACAQVQSEMAAKPLEAIATTTFPSLALPDIEVALRKAPRHERQVGQPFCAIR